VFTIPIGDMHVDEKDDVTWTCEAFGIPDVRYEWLKNGKTLVANSSKMAVEDRDRYEIRDNVLIIRSVSFLVFHLSPSKAERVDSFFTVLDGFDQLLSFFMHYPYAFD